MKAEKYGKPYQSGGVTAPPPQMAEKWPNRNFRYPESAKNLGVEIRKEMQV